MLSSRSMVDLSNLAPERVRLIRRVEFEQMAELDLFEDERVELLDGVIVEMTTPGTRHSESVSRVMKALFVLEFQGRARIRVQMPVALDDYSLPQPDLAVVPRADYSHEHPSVSLPLIEIADASLRKDVQVKAALYAAHGVRESWIINLVDDVVEIRRDPGPNGYRTLGTHGRGARVAPLAFPDQVVAVDDRCRRRRSRDREVDYALSSSCSQAPTRPASAPPAIGASQKSHSCEIAQSPTKMAGPVLRAGLTDTFVIGIPTRCTSVSVSPMGMPANPATARFEVAPRITVKKMKVSKTSANSAAPRP
jgi:Uma2 family endonuclease